MKIEISAEPAAPPGAGVKVHVREGEDMRRSLVIPKDYEGMVVEDCEDCPFFVDGAAYEYGVGCNVGGSPRETTFTPNCRGFDVAKTAIPDDCPLPKAKGMESD